MSLSPLVSFKSQFVTYLLNFPRTMLPPNATALLVHTQEVPGSSLILDTDILPIPLR